MLGLWESLDDADQAAFGFDPRIGRLGRATSPTIHLPSTVQSLQARVKTTPGAKNRQRLA